MPQATRSRALSICVATAMALSAAHAGEDARDLPAPRPAHEVIVRGRGTLERALISACAPVLRADGQLREVTVIVDPTRSLAAVEEDLVAALVTLETRAPTGLRWNLATLGRAPEASRSTPSALSPSLARALEPHALIVDTLTSLRDTAAACPERSLLVYIATENFEDERDVEGVARALHTRGQVLAVVGPESGFLRAWNDGFFPPYRGRRNADGSSTYYDTHVGRSPLAATNTDADADASTPAWHGPETAVPLAPSRFGDHFDGRLFTHRDEVDAETGEPTRRTYSHAYPSGWGPWSLMRLAAVTGGRYVTWSTRPSGEAVRYDGSRLDLLAPDLRARSDVLAAAAKRPLRAAIVRVWGETTDATSAVFGSTPPVRSDLESPIRMGEPRSRLRPPRLLYERSDHARFVDECPRLIRLLDGAIRRIEAAMARTDRPRNDAQRRDLADARLLRHVLLCERFAWGEALARGQRLMPRPWRDDGMVPKVDSITYVQSVGGRERIDDVEIVDTKRAEELLAGRRFLIETYAGTPWGELVRRNRIFTYTLKRVRLASGDPTRRRGLAESEPRPPDVTPSGGTQGPSTGD